MEQLSNYINLPILWVFAIGVFGVITLQTVIYMKVVGKVGGELDFTKKDLWSSFRTGAVASVGPSLAVVIVAVALLALFGTPAVLVRIGLVGSVATETASAGLAANTMGADLGGSGYSAEVFAVAFFAMAASGGMWMVVTLVLTPLLKRGDAKLRRVNPAFMAIVPSAALLAAFGSLSIGELRNSAVHLITVLMGAITMAACLVLSKALGQAWLREWALGFSIILSLVVAYFAHYSDVVPTA